MNQEYTYKFRIYPTEEQKVLCAKTFGCVRWVYNHFLNKRKTEYLESKKLGVKHSQSYFKDSKELPELKNSPETAFLKEVSAQSIQYGVKCLDVAYGRFFKKTAGFPTFKKRNGKNSFRVPQGHRIETGKLYLPKFNGGIPIVVHRKIEGNIKFVTITKSSSGRYHAMVGVERDIKPKESTGTVLGIDLGIKDFVVTSEGSKFENPQFYRKSEPRIKFLSKELARKVKDSKSRNKARVKLAKLHEKVANQRSNYIHKLSSRLINENQVICIEDLNVAGMLKNHCLAKSISDVSLYELKRQLTYKALWYGREIVKIGRFFPSSKTCSHCGHINQSLTLNDRVWTCPKCGEVLDRDVNAARNIEKQGLNLLHEQKTEGTSGLADCLGVRPKSSAMEIEATDWVGKVPLVAEEASKSLA